MGIANNVDVNTKEFVDDVSKVTAKSAILSATRPGNELAWWWTEADSRRWGAFGPDGAGDYAAQVGYPVGS